MSAGHPKIAIIMGNALTPEPQLPPLLYVIAKRVGSEWNVIEVRYRIKKKIFFQCAVTFCIQNFCIKLNRVG